MPLRSCRVSIRDVEGITHPVEIQAETLHEAAAAAIGIFRQHEWTTPALTRRAILRVEVQLPAVVHEVPLRAVERWMSSPATSPRDALAKKSLR